MHLCNHRSSQFIIGIVVTAFFAAESLAQEKTDWKDRFFEEAPKHWEEYIRFARCLQITMTANISDDRSPDKRSIRTEYKQSKGACLRVNDVNPGSMSQSEAQGTNPSYSFELKRQKSGQAWIIKDLELPDQSTTSSDLQRKLQETYFRLIACNGLMLENLWLPTLIKDPDFKITAIKPQEIDDHPVIRIDFDYPKPDKDYPVQGAVPLKGGWMVLDPEHDWTLREYVVHTGNPEKNYMHQTIVTREGTNRHPIVTHRSYKRIVKGEKPFQLTIESEWQTVEQSDVPRNEFTLSAFGLPEPTGNPLETQERGSRLYLWTALVGIICLGIAALIRWQLRHPWTAR